MKATIKGFAERWVLSPEWKSEGVMGDESGESIEPMEGVPFKRTGWVRIEKLVRVWRREARSWFQRQGKQTKLAIRRDHPRRRIKMLFYRAMLRMCGTSHGPMCVSVFVTSRSTKTAKHRITKTNHMIAQGV